MSAVWASALTEYYSPLLTVSLHLSSMTKQQTAMSLSQNKAVSGSMKKMNKPQS